MSRLRGPDDVMAECSKSACLAVLSTGIATCDRRQAFTVRRYGDIDFLHYAWGALMQNQFKPHPTALFNGQPVLEYYYLHGARTPGMAWWHGSLQNIVASRHMRRFRLQTLIY